MSREIPISSLAGGERLLSVEVGELPAPAHAPLPGAHLLVNCVYHPSVGELPPESLLAVARADTQAILRLFVTQGALADTVAVCVSFYTHADRLVPRRRLYRFSVPTSSFSRDAQTVDYSSCTPATDVIESSQRPDIARLLAE